MLLDGCWRSVPTHTNPSRHLLRDDNFRQGIAELEKRSLSFDAWLYHPQIAELIELAQDFSSLTIIADHFCGPLGIGPYAGQQQAVYADWQADFKALGECQNVPQSWVAWRCPSMDLAGTIAICQPVL